MASASAPGRPFSRSPRSSATAAPTSEKGRTWASTIDPPCPATRERAARSARRDSGEKSTATSKRIFFRAIAPPILTGRIRASPGRIDRRAFGGNHPVAAGALGFVERRVGPAQRGVDRLLSGAQHGDADRDLSLIHISEPTRLG